MLNLTTEIWTRHHPWVWLPHATSWLWAPFQDHRPPLPEVPEGWATGPRAESEGPLWFWSAESDHFKQGLQMLFVSCFIQGDVGDLISSLSCEWKDWKPYKWAPGLWRWTWKGEGFYVLPRWRKGNPELIAMSRFICISSVNAHDNHTFEAKNQEVQPYAWCTRPTPFLGLIRKILMRKAHFFYLSPRRPPNNCQIFHIDVIRCWQSQ